jgi:hypothetical protein
VTTFLEKTPERHDRATLVNTLDSLTGIPPHIVKMKSSSKNTDSYRKRAKEIDKRLKERPSAADRAKLLKKQKALNDMADNKDWLAGKPGSQLK